MFPLGLYNHQRKELQREFISTVLSFPAVKEDTIPSFHSVILPRLEALHQNIYEEALNGRRKACNSADKATFEERFYYCDSSKTYFCLVEISFLSVHHSFQKKIRLFQWNRFTKCLWKLPPTSDLKKRKLKNEEYELFPKAEVHRENEEEENELEYLDNQIFFEAVQNNSFESIIGNFYLIWFFRHLKTFVCSLGRKLLFLSLDLCYFSSDDLKNEFKKDSLSANELMIHNIQKIPFPLAKKSTGQEMLHTDSHLFLWKPAFLQFSKASADLPLERFIINQHDHNSVESIFDGKRNCSSHDILLYKSFDEVEKCLRSHYSIFQDKNQPSPSKRNKMLPGQCNVSGIFHSSHITKLSESQSNKTARNEMTFPKEQPKSYHDYQESQFMSQLYYYSPAKPRLQQTDKVEIGETVDRIIIPVTAHNENIKSLFSGISADLIALSYYREKRNEIDTIDYSDICLKKVGELQNSVNKDHLVILRILPSWNDTNLNVEPPSEMQHSLAGTYDQYSIVDSSVFCNNGAAAASSPENNFVALLERVLC
jgi:hypothetical protein